MIVTTSKSVVLVSLKAYCRALRVCMQDVSDGSSEKIDSIANFS